MNKMTYKRIAIQKLFILDGNICIFIRKCLVFSQKIANFAPDFAKI